MSYDVYLHIDTGSGELVTVWDRNHTSNTSRMWRAAGADLAEMQDWSARDVGVAVRAAVKAMRTDPATYREMNPPNGWGSYKTCLEFLVAIAEACDRHPDCTFYVSH